MLTAQSDTNPHRRRRVVWSVIVGSVLAIAAAVLAIVLYSAGSTAQSVRIIRVWKESSQESLNNPLLAPPNNNLIALGSDIWMTDGGATVTALNTSNLSQVRQVWPSSNSDISSWGFAGPIVKDGPDLFVAADGPVVELTAANGNFVQSLGVVGCALAPDGQYLWIASRGDDTDGSVTEVDIATGDIIQTLTGAEYGISAQPCSLASDGTDLWVANSEDGVTEIDESDGSVVQVLSSTSYGFNGPVALLSAGTHLWVANYGDADADSFSSSLTEIDESTGDLVRVIAGSDTGLDFPLALASDGGRLWVANDEGNSVTEIDESSGRLLKVLRGPAYGFDAPCAFAVEGNDLWVAGTSLTELSI